MAEGPPSPPHPKAVASHVKGMFSGHPKWVWALGLSVAVGVAYLAWRRSQNAAATGATGGMGSVDGTYTDPGSPAYGDSGSGFSYGSTPDGSGSGYTDGSSLAVDPNAAQYGGDPYPTVDDIYGAIQSGMAGIVAPSAQGTAVAPQDSPQVTGGGAPAQMALKKTVAPQLGPNIFYNPDRGVRYIVQGREGRGNFRLYESKLNKGDWGQGGAVPIGGAPTTPSTAHASNPATTTASPTGGGAPSHAATPAAPAKPQPILGPNVFYNADRNLRYIVQKTRGKDYRYYESALNRGDWGKGPVIPV